MHQNFFLQTLDASNDYFFITSKKSRQKKIRETLKDEVGEVVTAIEEAIRQFYSKKAEKKLAMLRY